MIVKIVSFGALVQEPNWPPLFRAPYSNCTPRLPEAVSDCFYARQWACHHTVSLGLNMRAPRLAAASSDSTYIYWWDRGSNEHSMEPCSLNMISMVVDAGILKVGQWELNTMALELSG